jgi:hypothetical protein
MQLTHYNITCIVSDPDSPETKVQATLERCKREKILEKGGVVASLVATLEEFVVRGGEGD